MRHPSVSLTTSPTAGLTNGGCFPVGVTTVTITATDAKGNVETCIFTVTVTKTDPCATDTEKPKIANCAANISLTTTGTCANAQWAIPTITDNCGTPSVSLTTSPTAGLTNGGCFPVGVTTVTITATDAKGNVETCIFTVTVTKTDPCATDTEKPKIANCPANITASTGNPMGATISWARPTITDNCGTPTVTLTTAPTTGLTNGGIFPMALQP
ncbi:MAG: HYR domain-containing protein [Saprospiraceae bacterium]|nr:HYR domain-containing protein [Saprospiraceae bacterium]